MIEQRWLDDCDPAAVVVKRLNCGGNGGKSDQDPVVPSSRVFEASSCSSRNLHPHGIQLERLEPTRGFTNELGLLPGAEAGVH
ncbi:hypothetical protein M5K25_024828 [Dendrobium thyrsiflorum]|uniref:Uncharacterized protein n=1 Tax=Dendrobium thyrsiflorum TaxID=117978 RepID=A0ABD0U7I3_DENTH